MSCWTTGPVPKVTFSLRSYPNSSFNIFDSELCIDSLTPGASQPAPLYGLKVGGAFITDLPDCAGAPGVAPPAAAPAAAPFDLILATRFLS